LFVRHIISRAGLSRAALIDFLSLPKNFRFATEVFIPRRNQIFLFFYPNPSKKAFHILKRERILRVK